MKIAMVRSTLGAGVIQRLGRQNQEFYQETDIEAACDALAERGHDVTILEGDLTLIDRLQDLLQSNGSDSEKSPLMVYNLAYGVQGESRYTHVPALLELIGIPYTGSGPRAHTISLDKYAAKTVLEHLGLPTPAFQLVEHATDSLRSDLTYPVIVKPHCESTSFGIRVVNGDRELTETAASILDEYQQPVLVEEFITGTEVNCGVFGNDPPEALPVLEIDFGDDADGSEILSFEAKRDRIAKHVCPARIPEEVAARVQQLSIDTFRALGCRDVARVDFRLDQDGNPFILELNSMACIHRAGSVYHAAQTRGMTYSDMINRVLEAAIARYEDQKM